MKKLIPVLILIGLLSSAFPAYAHFGMVIPSDQMVMQGEDRNVHLLVKFWHPFEGMGMNLDKPKDFFVVAGGEKAPLPDTLREKKIGEFTAWETDYSITRPGLYVFVLEPQPYWEPEEDCFIIHYTKAYVAAYGDDEGWDEPVGLKTEIVPLSKPYGLYAGNVFQGRVMLDGQPVPWAEVEVEFDSGDIAGHAPSDFMVTQTIKADGDGIFTYAAPKAGMWGFAALNTADYKIQHAGEDKDVELGAVIWVRFHEMK